MLFARQYGRCAGALHKNNIFCALHNFTQFTRTPDFVVQAKDTHVGLESRDARQPLGGLIFSANATVQRKT